MQVELIQGMVLPSDNNLESAVIGALLIDSNAINVIGGILRDSDFYINSHRLIYQAIQNLFIDGKPIDLLIVNDELTRLGKIEEVGGLAYLMQLCNVVGTSVNIEYHAQIILNHSIKRQIIKISYDAISKSFSSDLSANEILSESINNLSYENRMTKKKETNMEAYQTVIKMLEDGKLKGMPTGLNQFDKYTGGLNGFVVLAAGPSEGKSTLALNIAKKVSINDDVLYFSLEMEKYELITRLISDEINVTVNDLKNNKFDQSLLSKSIIPDLKLEILTMPGLYVDDFCAISKSKMKNSNLKLIIVDYLQLLQGSRTRKFGTRENEVSYISTKIKALQLELGIPIIALSQFSRANKGMKRQYYTLSDLRESGSIEQDANQVIAIYRPIKHYESGTFDYAGESINIDNELAILEVLKNRDNELCKFRQKFIGQYCRFEDYVIDNNDNNFRNSSVHFNDVDRSVAPF